MKTLKLLCGVLAVLSLLVLVASFPVESSYRAKAKMYQRVEKSAGAELFGEAATPVGSPQLSIVDDPKSVLPGKGDDGSLLLDEAYLREHNQKPLQFITVQFLAGIARMIAGGLVIFFGLLTWWFTRKIKAKTAQSNSGADSK